MNTGLLITEFLRKVAEQEGYKILNEIYGEIDISTTPPITQSSGAVYGIWAKSKNPPKHDLKPIPDHTDWYPIYWGKDISPASRIKAHTNGHKNGNINLPKINKLKGLKLIFGAVLVERYEEFEKTLHEKYKPMLGKPTTGRKSTTIRILT